MFPILSRAQTLKRSVFISPNISLYNFYNGRSYEIFGLKEYLGWGGSFGYQLEYDSPKIINIGISAEYFLTRAKLFTYGYSGIPEVFARNKISTHSIDIPVFFKIKFNRFVENINYYGYLYGGFGVSWIFFSYRKLENEYHGYNNESESYIYRTKLVSESFSLKNNNNNGFGTYLQLGFGRNFKIKQTDFFTELLYRQDINKWIYRTNQLKPPYNIIEEYPIKRQGIILKIGIYFNRKTKENILIINDGLSMH